MRVYVVGFAPADGDAATGGFDWFVSPHEAVARARKDIREIGGLGKHSVTYVPLEVPDEVAYPGGQSVADRDAITDWIDSNLELVEVGLASDRAGTYDAAGPGDVEDADSPGEAGQVRVVRDGEERWEDSPQQQTRPSAILRRPDPDTAVSEATTAELLYEALERIQTRKRKPLVAEHGPILRELALAATAVEDAITRHNKAIYMERGVFAITDAERAAGESDSVDDGPEVVRDDARARILKGRAPVAVVARTLDDARRAAKRNADATDENGWVAVLYAASARGAHFSDAIFAPGWDRDRSVEEAEEIRRILEVGVRP